MGRQSEEQSRRRNAQPNKSRLPQLIICRGDTHCFFSLCTQLFYSTMLYSTIFCVHPPFRSLSHRLPCCSHCICNSKPQMAAVLAEQMGYCCGGVLLGQIMQRNKLDPIAREGSEYNNTCIIVSAISIVFAILLVILAGTGPAGTVGKYSIDLLHFSELDEAERTQQCCV